MSTDNTNFTVKSFLQDRYLDQKVRNPLASPSFRNKPPTPSLPDSDKSFDNLNVSADRSVSRWTPDPSATTAARILPSSKRSVRPDAWCEAAAVDHAQPNSQPAAEESSIEKNKKMFSRSYQKFFPIGLSIGVVLSGTILVIVLSLWLSHSVDTTTRTSVNNIDSNTGATSTSSSSSNNTTAAITSITTNSSTITTTSSTSTTTTTAPWVTILYDFDQEVNDVYSNSFGKYNGLATNSSTYISPGITGYGYAMNFGSTNPHTTVTIQNWINLNNASFTIEFWIYLTSAPNATSGDLGVFGQCQNPTNDYCLHILVQGGKIRFAFYADDGIGTTNLSVGVWYHIACVFARSTLRQIIYVNGLSEYYGSVNSAFLATNTTSTIGVTYAHGFALPSYFQNGRIDQLSIAIHHAKNASDIFDDATLSAYFSFDSSTYFWLDNGPQFLNGTYSGNVTSVAGRVGRAIAFSGSSGGSYFQIASKFVLLTVKSQPHTYAFWINPANNSGTIIQESSGGTTAWSMVPLGYTSNGQISAQVWNSSYSQYCLTAVPSLNTWTHIAMTYSFTVGIKVYMNGSLYATNALNPLFYDAPSSSTATLTLGYTNQVNEAGQVIIGQFVGAIDELRVYSRALSGSEVAALANV